MIEKYDVKLPYAAYKLRIKECKKGQSKNGFPQLQLDLELIEAAPLEVEGETVDINGLMFKYWVTITPKSIRFVNEFMLACEMDEINESEVNNIEAGLFVGRTLTALCVSTLEPKKNPETGAPVINPLTGKPIMIGGRKVDQILNKNS